MNETTERTIRLVTALSDKEREILYEWGVDIFIVDYFHLEWRPKDWHFLCYENGKLVSAAGVLQQNIFVGTHSVSVAGVGGVVTLPEARERGHATALMRQVADYIKNEMSVEFGMLFCHEELIPFFVRLGWQRIGEKAFVDQPSGGIDCPLPVMILSCHGETWRRGPVSTCSEPW